MQRADRRLSWSLGVSADWGRDGEEIVNPIEQVFSKLTGILILIVPRLLSFIVAIYLIIVRLIGLNAIHHFIR